MHNKNEPWFDDQRRGTFYVKEEVHLQDPGLLSD